MEGQRVGHASDTLPADLRVDWFNLAPTPAFSPFATLSAYTGASQASAQRIPDVVRRPPASAPEPTIRVAPPPVANSAPLPKPPRPAPARATRRPEPVPVPDPVSVVGGTAQGCEDLVGLEAPAMIGQLDADQLRCLEGRVARDPKQTAKKHASMVLIANAWGGGKRDQWETLVLRHLEEIDQSDPALCYKLALHLEQQGPPRAAEVIRWADLSMKNARRMWSGEEYTDKMYSLHRLKSKAASELWYVTEQRHVASPTPQTGDAVEKYRGQAKNFSKEWYQYARQAGKDTTHPREMCLSAAGTSDFCEDA